MTPTTKSRVFANLSNYLHSGMGIENACRSLLEQPGCRGHERELHRRILDGLARGSTIADAIASSPGIAPLDHQLLRASERAGRLETGLEHLARYYQRADQTRRRVRKGLIYPLVLFHLALFITTFTQASLLRFNPERTDTGLLQAMGESGGWAAGLYLAILVLGLVFWWLRQAAPHSVWADHILAKLPLSGAVRRYAALERFCSVFEISLLAGMRMDECFVASGSVAESARLRRAAEDGAARARAGEPVAAVFLDHPGAFPRDLARGVASAEASGLLDREFRNWTHFYGEALSGAMDQLAEWAPKIVYFLSVFVVAWMIVRVALSYGALIEAFQPF